MRTDLLDLANGRTLNFFALGGSGARALEPLLHLCAVGLGPERLRVVIIDPDQANAAVTRARRLLEQYRQIRAAVNPSGQASYFRTEVVDPLGSALVWSPIDDGERMMSARFANRVDRPSMQVSNARALAYLYDLLFAERIRDMDLGMGFRGVPAIGTVFMHRLQAVQWFEQLLLDAQTERDSTFFAVGSVFGGTGASALPVVGQALRSGIRGVDGRPDLAGIEARRLGAALLLPYFTLPVPSSSTAADGGVRPEAALFAQNAAAALPTYLGGDSGYGGIYAIGDSKPRQQQDNVVGGQEQANTAHYVELYAALAALDFAAGNAMPDKAPTFRMAAVGGIDLRWEDLPITSGSLRRLMGGVVSAHTFLTVFRPDGKPQPELTRMLKGATWLELLRMRTEDLQENARWLDLIGEYFSHMWDWLGEMRASTPALVLANADGRSASRVGMHESLQHLSLGGEREAGTIRDPFVIFRHWNEAAHRYRGSGITHFLDVMRRGSEAFAEVWFGAPKADTERT